MRPGVWLALLVATVAGQPASAAPALRGPASFEQWAASRQSEVAEFQQYLKAQGLSEVVPLWQLLRTASDWQRCQAEPFALAPQSQWQAAAATLRLLRQLREQKIVGDWEVVSSWRSEVLNRCAKGSPRSAHVRSFAVDFVPGAPAQGLCNFWKTQGRAWNMGLSRYPSGRVHVDTAGYRTWGEDYTQGSSFCR